MGLDGTSRDVAGRSFGTSPTGPARFDLTKLVPLLEAVHERLSAVTIECLPYDWFIRAYDRPGALFYLDPPYAGSENDYNDTGDLFGRMDFGHLAELPRTVRGQVIVSLNDHPVVRQAFGRGFEIEEIETTYTVTGGGRTKPVTALVIRRS